MLQQIIGRARVDRKKPRPVTVLIPDYNTSDLGAIKSSVYTQFEKARQAIENPDAAMEHFAENRPYIYYSAFAKKVEPNSIAISTLRKQLDFLTAIKAEEEENPHAFVRKVLETYDVETEDFDKMFLGYESVAFCKAGINQAWCEFVKSDHGDEALKELKIKLKEICNSTGAYSKTLDSNIQISTVNDILAFAGINERLNPKRTVYEISKII